MKKVLFLTVITLTILACSNDIDYMDAYKKGYEDGIKSQKTYFEFKNVPYSGDTTISYKSEDNDYIYNIVISYENNASEIQLKYYSK